MNYNEQMEFEISNLQEQGKRPKLLLHTCCGPCSSAVLERLADFFEITIYYYNPNIYPEKEFLRRRNELENFIKVFPVAKNISVIEANYEPEDFFNATGVRENTELQTESERGERCRRCYKLRLEKTFAYALENRYDYITTTLSISPYKDCLKINTIGKELEEKYKSDIKFLYADFKKKNGFLRSLKLSEEYGLYRQDYCGCVYSLQNGGKSAKDEK